MWLINFDIKLTLFLFHGTYDALNKFILYHIRFCLVMIIYQRMKLRKDIFLNVMHPAMFTFQVGVAIVSVCTTSVAFSSNLIILTRLNTSTVTR